MAGQKDWQKCKEKFDNSSRKLHMNHNEYFLAIRQVNEHQSQSIKSLTPHLLDSIHDLQKQYITAWLVFFGLFDNSC